MADVESNLVGTLGFLKACVDARVGKVVFLSSGGTVYGIPEVSPVPEDHPQHPICSYAVVKLAIEKYLRLFHRLHGLPYVILRPAYPYGPRQDPRVKQGAVAVFLGKIAKRERIKTWGDGEVVRDYFHVRDLARACVAAAETPLSGAVLNLGSGGGKSLNELIMTVETVIGRPVAVDRLPSRSFDVQRIVLDIGRAHRELGWTPEIPLDIGLRETWQWVEANHPFDRRDER